MVYSRGEKVQAASTGSSRMCGGEGRRVASAPTGRMASDRRAVGSGPNSSHFVIYAEVLLKRGIICFRTAQLFEAKN